MNGIVNRGEQTQDYAGLPEARFSPILVSCMVHLALERNRLGCKATSAQTPDCAALASPQSDWNLDNCFQRPIRFTCAMPPQTCGGYPLSRNINRLVAGWLSILLNQKRWEKCSPM